MSRSGPRRPASSRGTTARPRRLAGHDAPAPAAESPETESPETESPETESPETASPAPEERPTLRKTAADESAEPPAGVVLTSHGTQTGGALASPSLTRVLTVVLAVVAVVLAVLGVVLARQHDDAVPVAKDSAGLGVGDDRPVVARQLQVLDGVDAAAKAAQEIVSVDYTKYDAEVDGAAKLMTARFAKEYRGTAEEIADDVVAKQTKVQASVVAQGVVRAGRTRLEALVFLNQVVNRVEGGKPDTIVTPFKVLVTMVHTDRGWFVDDLATDVERPDASPSAP